MPKRRDTKVIVKTPENKTIFVSVFLFLVVVYNILHLTFQYIKLVKDHVV